MKLIAFCLLLLVGTSIATEITLDYNDTYSNPNIIYSNITYSTSENTTDHSWTFSTLSNSESISVFEIFCIIVVSILITIIIIGILVMLFIVLVELCVWGKKSRNKVAINT